MAKKMKSIVFGGSGFIGSHVADVLLERGHRVKVYDIKPSAYLQKGQEMIVGDLMNEERVSSAVKGEDFVYNFAGISDIEESGRKPLESVKYNILGNSIVLEACRKAHVQRFVLASSIYVYSNSGSFYRSTKQACELIVENYQEAYGLRYTILRYGSLYGPRADEKNYIHRIIKQALTENKITREGDGEEIREYIHVLGAAQNSVDILTDEFLNQSVIIAGQQQMKAKDLLLMIKEMLQNKIKIEFIPATHRYHYEITPYVFVPKIAKRLVGTIQLDLGQGILQCIESIYKEIHFKE